MPGCGKGLDQGTIWRDQEGPVSIEVSGIGRTVRIQKDHSILDLAGEGRLLSVTVHEAVPLAPDSVSMPRFKSIEWFGLLESC